MSRRETIAEAITETGSGTIPETIHERKRRIRREIASRRDLLEPAERLRLGEAIGARFAAHPRVAAASVLMIYHTFRSEAPTEPLLAALSGREKQLALPYMIGVGRKLVAAAYRPGDPLEPGPYGVPQPSRLEEIPVSRIGIVVVPGVAFDRSGGRMGYGKGYYDRFLALRELDAWLVGMAYDLQVVESLPLEPHDRPVDALVTESGLRDLRDRPPTSLDAAHKPILRR